MLTQPTVYAVMVTADRPEMAKRAVECFRAQTYPAKRMLILDTQAGPPPSYNRAEAGEISWYYEPNDGRDIAALRNVGNALTAADIIVHFDDDDWSHPNRIAEQVALLQSGADLVGYNEMLFWRDRSAPRNVINGTGEAWLYTGDILGTSMAYWRKTWERVPFQGGGHHNEDAGFAMGVRAAGMRTVTCHSIASKLTENAMGRPNGNEQTKQPRMIARIHKGNAKNPSYDPAQMAVHPHHWQRVPAWDKYCEGVMER